MFEPLTHRAVSALERSQRLPQGFSRVLEHALWQGLLGLRPKRFSKLLDKTIVRRVLEQGAHSDRETSDLIGTVLSSDDTKNT